MATTALMVKCIGVSKLSRFSVAVALLMYAGAAAAQTPQDWRLDIGGTVTVTGTDNVEIDQAERRSDLVTTTQFNVGVNRSSRTTTARLTGNLAWDAYAKTSRLNGLRYDALALVNSQLIDRRLDIDVRVNTTQQDVSGAGATSAVDRSIGSNQTQIVNVSASPTLRTTVRDWAVAEANYSVSGAFYFSTDTSPTAPPVSDAVIHRGRVSLSTGTRFPRFRLTGIATAEETNREASAQNSARRDIQADAEYQLYPRFRLTANVGYEEIEEPNFAADLEDPFGTVGFRWNPGTRTQITFNGGYRYQGPNFNGRISYTFGERLNLIVNYSESIENQQRLALGNLGDITFDELGTPVNTITGQELSPGGLPFDLQDNAFRRDAVSVSVSGLIGRNRYSIGGQYEVRDTNGVSSNTVGLNASLSRDLTERASLTLAGSIQETEQATTGTDRTWTARSVYRYRLSETFDLDARYAFVKRESIRSLTFHENVLRISATKRF